MNATVLRFSKGAFNLRIPAQGQDEVAQLGKSFNLMADALNNLEQARRSFVKVIPRDYERVLGLVAEAEAAGASREAALERAFDVMREG